MNEINRTTTPITASNADFSFFGAKPSEITRLCGVNSGIQGLHKKITSIYLLLSTASATYHRMGSYQELDLMDYLRMYYHI